MRIFIILNGTFQKCNFYNLTVKLVSLHSLFFILILENLRQELWKHDDRTYICIFISQLMKETQISNILLMCNEAYYESLDGLNEQIVLYSCDCDLIFRI